MANVAECSGAIHLCRTRVTRLDQLGNPLPGPNNFYVTDKPLMLTVTPQIEAGQDKPLVGGCDCIVLMYRGFDKLKYWTLEFDLAVIEPALLEMLLGAPARTGANNIDVVGIDWPNQLTCSNPVQPNVCLEGWQDAWVDDHQDPNLPYWHFCWPSARFQSGAMTLQNDFNQPKLTGWTRGNPQWGVGIYGDVTKAWGVNGGVEQTAVAPPSALCSYQWHTIT